MKELTAILAFLLLLTSCGQSQDSSDSPPMTSADNTTISAEEKDETSPVTTTESLTSITTVTTETQPTTAVTQETTAVSVTEPVSTAETAETHSEEQSTPDTAQAAETPQTAATTAEQTTLPTTTKAVQQTVPTTAVTEPPTEAATEPPTEPKTVLPNDGTDYGKAKAVYDCMIENGHGTCVNYSCQTYELCQDIGLECYLVWTDAGLYGHVANIVNVDGVWYVLDTEDGFFLDYNYCFTEVVDIDGNHIADSDIISSYSYNELH